MKTLIAGAGRFGSQAAQVLAAAGHEVTLIDLDDDRVTALRDAIPARVVSGDACEPNTLEEAGALGADILVAATGDDEDNLVISLLSKRQFAVPRVAARVNDPDNTWLFDEHWGVDVAVPASAPLISIIEEATDATDTVALLRLSKAGVSVIETVIGPRSTAIGRRPAEIDLPSGTIVVAIIRDGAAIVPDAGTRLRTGDELLVVSRSANEADIHAAFQ
jgi:trk system potassium uptake protein TrkA